MPFAGTRPAMGPSLLVGHLQRIGVPAEVLYLNMAMARRLGSSDYDYIANRAPTQSLAGDWVFAQSLFGERPAVDAEYIASFRSRFSRNGSDEVPVATLARARAHAEAFIEEC